MKVFAGSMKKILELKEGGCYVNNKYPNYFRRIEFILESPSRSGGFVVLWNTDGFSVKEDSNGSKLNTRGRCSITTFKAWADHEI